MIKHLRYFLSPFILVITIVAVLKGSYYPLAFIIASDTEKEILLKDTF